MDTNTLTRDNAPFRARFSGLEKQSRPVSGLAPDCPRIDPD
jgi:hypothetical protein